MNDFSTRMTSCQLYRIASLFIAATLLPGCQQSHDLVPVYGKVIVAGREAPQVCRLFFTPTGGGRPSAAEADESGDYRVTSFRGAEGMPPGSYRVRVTYFDLKPGTDPNNDANWIQHDYEAGELKVDAESDGVQHDITVPAQS
jgi:hypothetical protein